jgi:hypothetical protein
MAPQEIGQRSSTLAENARVEPLQELDCLFALSVGEPAYNRGPKQVVVAGAWAQVARPDQTFGDARQALIAIHFLNKTKPSSAVLVVSP